MLPEYVGVELASVLATEHVSALDGVPGDMPGQQVTDEGGNRDGALALGRLGRTLDNLAGVIEYQRQFQLVLKLDDTPLVGQNMSGEQKADALKALEDAKALVEFQDHYKTRPGNSDTYTVQIAECAIDLDTPGAGTAIVTLVEQ